MSDIIQNPYVGPRTFTRAEADRYYGRETEAADLLSLVISERLVLFYAQSGAGKSSLINTRLTPGLQAESFLTLPVGRVSGELPAGVEQVDNIFVFNLLLNLDQSGTAPDRFAHMSLTDFLAHLNTTDGEHYFFDDSSPETDDEDEDDYEEPAHVLIIDQFEEIVTTHLDRWQERSTFFRQLGQAMADDSLLWIVLTLREDYVAALDPYARLLPGKMRARFYMQRMGYDAALEAVKYPAEQGGRSFDDGVAETLVNNLRQIRAQGEAATRPGQFVEPVQLQVVCYQLWENLKGRAMAAALLPDEETNIQLITHNDLTVLGNIDTALAQFYEEVIHKTLEETGGYQLELRNWFDHKLITEAGTRGTVYQGEEDTAGLPNALVKSLADQFLLRAEIRGGGVWYELVHDRFVEPILQANQTWQVQQSPLIRAAQEWDRTGRNKETLYLGPQLQNALNNAGREVLESLVETFLTASVEENHAQEVEERREEAEAQTQQQRKVARRRIIMMGILIFLALFSGEANSRTLLIGIAVLIIGSSMILIELGKPKEWWAGGGGNRIKGSLSKLGTPYLLILFAVAGLILVTIAIVANGCGSFF